MPAFFPCVGRLVAGWRGFPENGVCRAEAGEVVPDSFEQGQAPAIQSADEGELFNRVSDMNKRTFNSSRVLPGAMPFLTDGGIETFLIYKRALDLPHFAAFSLMGDEQGRSELASYYEGFILQAATKGFGFVLEAPTWRASQAWGDLLGLGASDLDRLNTKAIDLMIDLRCRYQTTRMPMVVSGNIGPRGDGYKADAMMTADEATAYHSTQIETFARSSADIVSAFTMTYVNEALGIARAARHHRIPAVIAFTVETDGRLPSGERLGDAVAQIDDDTNGHVDYYMINCAHPSHFASELSSKADWVGRIGGLRANASAMSHDELDNCCELDEGNPAELAGWYARLAEQLPNLRVFGGCCGTDHRHVQEIASMVVMNQVRRGLTRLCG